jgi:mycoredoxin
MSEKIILYGHRRCPMVAPVEAVLQYSRADYQYIDIDLSSSGRLQVLEINQGNASVPTLVFPDGSSLTEPSRSTLKAKLRELGFLPDVQVAAIDE